jgi:hypothetical protein
MRPIPTTAEERLTRLGRDVEALKKRPGAAAGALVLPALPNVISGSRSTNTVAILTELLATLDALGIIVDNTTG